MVMTGHSACLTQNSLTVPTKTLHVATKNHSDSVQVNFLQIFLTGISHKYSSSNPDEYDALINRLWQQTSVVNSHLPNQKTHCSIQNTLEFSLCYLRQNSPNLVLPHCTKSYLFCIYFHHLVHSDEQYHDTTTDKVNKTLTDERVKDKSYMTKRN